MGYWENDNAIKSIAYKLMLDYLRLKLRKPYRKSSYISTSSRFGTFDTGY
ncbi:MAG: hypothetical protein ACI87A_002553 [Planctomycetota bacterium]|jgi:hypothetical protein